jgi:predicted CXXCH cytochrome family protein
MKRVLAVSGCCVTLLLLGFWSSPATAADACVSSSCHANFGAAPFVHGPVAVGDCRVCHQATGVAHPGPLPAFQLKNSGARLCEQCHPNPAAGKAHLHAPVTEGNCLACHDPHGAANPMLLIADQGVLCRACHAEIGARGRIHGPVRAGRCDYCHLPHGGNEPGLLKSPGNRVCFACHSGILTTIETAKSQHKPVADGRCWDCHENHSAEFRPLLQGYYPREFYVPYEADNFSLCFDCHAELGKFEYQRTSEATGFRNGDANLHYLHVNKPVKGRVCRNCHGIHGADQLKLILSRVPGFGQWKIPVRFLPTETGATCLAGCHKPKSYDRVRPVENP